MSKMNEGVRMLLEASNIQVRVGKNVELLVDGAVVGRGGTPTAAVFDVYNNAPAAFAERSVVLLTAAAMSEDPEEFAALVDPDDEDDDEDDDIDDDDDDIDDDEDDEDVFEDDE